MKRNKFFVIIILFVLALTVNSCIKISTGSDSPPNESKSKTQKASTDDKNANSENEKVTYAQKTGGPFGRNTYVYSVAAETAKKTDFAQEIVVGGPIQAKNTVSVSPDTNGVLTRVLVYEGQKVRKGTIIAYVDPSKAGQNFRESPVISPIAGIVSGLPATIGNTVSVQTIIATVSDDSEIEMKVNIPEKYVGKISTDTTARLRVIAYPDVFFPMKIKTLSSVLSSTTHTMPVTFSFLETDKRLKSGMYGDLVITLEGKEDVIVISRSTIVIRLQDSGQQKGIYLIKDYQKDNDTNSVYFSEVELGIENNNMVEVVSGINEGDIIITQGQDSLSDESTVRIFNLDGTVLVSVQDQIQRAQEEAAESEKNKVFKRSPKE